MEDKNNEEKYREIGVRLQKKYPKIDITHHFANCNVDDPVALGKMANEESDMWANMLKDTYWAPIGRKI